MPTPIDPGKERFESKGRLRSIVIVLLAMGAGGACASTPAAADAGACSIPNTFGGTAPIVCTQPVDCRTDGGALSCTWAEALAAVCPFVARPGTGYHVQTCTGGLNAWSQFGTDSGATVYYSAQTGRIVANIGGGAPGVGTCQSMCPPPDVTCTNDDGLCAGYVDASAGDSSVE
jgi:hypothetical protein